MKYTDHTGEPMVTLGGEQYGTVGEFIAHEDGRDVYSVVLNDDVPVPTGTPIVGFSANGHATLHGVM